MHLKPWHPPYTQQMLPKDISNRHNGQALQEPRWAFWWLRKAQSPMVACSRGTNHSNTSPANQAKWTSVSNFQGHLRVHTSPRHLAMEQSGVSMSRIWPRAFSTKLALIRPRTTTKVQQVAVAWPKVQSVWSEAPANLTAFGQLHESGAWSLAASCSPLAVTAVCDL